MRQVAVLVAALALAACTTVQPAPTTTTAPPTTKAVHAPLMIPPTIPAYTGSGEPLDVLVVGDSTAYGIDTYLRQIMLTRGYPGTVTLEWQGSTGIAGNPPPPLPPRDWVARISELVALHHPDVVVMEVIGSFDANPPHDTITRGTAFVDAVHAGGALVVWCRPAALLGKTAAEQAYHDSIIDALDAIPADAHADWRSLITPGDKYSQYGTTDRGVERIRTDNVHLDSAGRRLAAFVTMATLVPFWG